MKNIQKNFRHLRKKVSERYLKYILESVINEELHYKDGAEKIGVAVSTFYAYLHMYEKNPMQVLLEYKRRRAVRKFNTKQEAKICQLLETEFNNKKKIKNWRVNFDHMTEIAKDLYRIDISAESLRLRAVKLGYYKPQKRRRKAYIKHERGRIGSLVQMDASIHQWNPYLEPFSIILAVDDHSRKILGIEFAKRDNSMSNIKLLEKIVLKHGIPMELYVDRHSIYGYDAKKKEYPDDISEFESKQFKRIAEKILGIKIIYANSPQAKGKIESKFSYSQNRVMRLCLLQEVTSYDHTYKIIRKEYKKYNRRIHSNTNEKPDERFFNANKQGRTNFSPFIVKNRVWTQNGRHIHEIFAFEYNSKSDAYGVIKKFGKIFQIPYKNVRCKLYYYVKNDTGEIVIHIVYKDKTLLSQTF